jgi:hypothetical protein
MSDPPTTSEERQMSFGVGGAGMVEGDHGFPHLTYTIQAT